jgi:hypothetical protein
MSNRAWAVAPTNKEVVVIAEKRPLYEIAKEIRADWKPVGFAAKPYLNAMATLSDIGEGYGSDNAKTIVTYFLCNAQTWKGETARRVKAELKKLAGIK